MTDFGMRLDRTALPFCEGSLAPNRSLADLTWLQAGGPAEWLFQPANTEDLACFLRHLDPQIPVFVMGVGSNLIVRDGGIKGVVIRLGRSFSNLEFGNRQIVAGAFALGARVATKAAESGLELTYLRTIPGTVGGAVKMNAGCYGVYTADVVKEVKVVTRQGETRTINRRQLGFDYRRSRLPEGSVVIEVLFECNAEHPVVLAENMARQLRHRNATQPTRVRTAGSTFRNPAGHSSSGYLGEDHSMKAWKLIEDSGMRGATRGNAQMSAKHANFLVNTGGTTATELELLGEEVREAVRLKTGIMLEWELVRIGERSCRHRKSK